MGQTCGAADPSQWMRMFGVDIDSRDTTELIRAAGAVTAAELAARSAHRRLFGAMPERQSGQRAARCASTWRSRRSSRRGVGFFTPSSPSPGGGGRLLACFGRA